MKLRITIYLLSIFFFLIACDKEKTQNTAQESTPASTIDTLSIPSATGLKPSLRLIPKAQDAVKDWNLYQTVSKRLDSLQEVSLGTVKNQLNTIIPLFDGQQDADEEDEILLEPIPNDLNKSAIKARLLTVETQIKVLNNYAQKSDPDAQEIAAAVVALKNAFQNLNLQINENFSLSIEEMLKQLNQSIDDPESEEGKKGKEEVKTPRGKPPVEIYKTKQ